MPKRIDSPDCYEKALPGEPRFTLLARDPDAPVAMRAWANARRERLGIGKDDPDIADVIERIGQFKSWREENDGKWREPQPERPSDEMTSLAGKVLAAENPMSGDPASLEQLIADAKSLAGAVLRLDPVAGQTHG